MKAGLMLGVNSESKREDNDFYATDPYAMKIVIPVLKDIGLSNDIWECACGNGSLSKVLSSFGYNVKSTDLIDRGYGSVCDFLSCNQKFKGDIITNPPFSKALDFIEHALSLVENDRLVCMLLKIQFLETKKRKEFLPKNGLEYVIVNSERICCAMNGDFDKYFNKKGDKYCGGTQFYAWYVFRKGYVGDTKILWI